LFTKKVGKSSQASPPHNRPIESLATAAFNGA